MPRPPTNPLNYVNVFTKLPLHMHRWYTIQAASFGMERMVLYMFALKFAFHSNTEFKEFVRTILNKDDTHATKTK